MSSIIQLSVGIDSAATPRTSFGTPLILDHENVQNSQAGAPVIGTYGSLEEVAEDFEPYHAAYNLAKAIFAQQPRPALVKIAGAATGTEADDLGDIVDTDRDWYVLLYTNRTAADIKAAAAWVETAPSRCIYVAETNDAAAKAAGSTVLTQLHALGYKRTAAWYRAPVVSVHRLVLDKTFVADNTAAINVNGQALTQAYAVTHADTIDALASVIAAQPSVLSAVVSVSGGLGVGVKDTITVTSKTPLIPIVMTAIGVTGGASQPSIALYEDTAPDMPIDGAVVGRVLPLGSGTATWAHKTMGGGCLPDTLTAGQKAIIEAAGGNWYATELGFDISYPGRMVGDSSPGTPMWIDLIQGMDALESDLQTALMNVLNQANKIPYTDAGVAAILSAYTQTEQKYVGTGFLVQKPFDETYEVPLVEDAVPADKSNRILRSLRAAYQTSGGIHAIVDSVIKLAA